MGITISIPSEIVRHIMMSIDDSRDWRSAALTCRYTSAIARASIAAYKAKVITVYTADDVHSIMRGEKLDSYYDPDDWYEAYTDVNKLPKQYIISYTMLEGKYHSFNGEPAIVLKSCKIWCRKGVLHNLGGPAILSTKKGEVWYCDGQMHRCDGPAVIVLYSKHKGGERIPMIVKWYEHGLIYRNYNLPATRSMAWENLEPIEVTHNWYCHVGNMRDNGMPTRIISKGVEFDIMTNNSIRGLELSPFIAAWYLGLDIPVTRDSIPDNSSFTLKWISTGPSLRRDDGLPEEVKVNNKFITLTWYGNNEQRVNEDKPTKMKLSITDENSWLLDPRLSMCPNRYDTLVGEYMEWKIGKAYHRNGDLPAIIDVRDKNDQVLEWYKYGTPTRDNKLVPLLFGPGLISDDVLANPMKLRGAGTEYVIEHTGDDSLCLKYIGLYDVDSIDEQYSLLHRKWNTDNGLDFFRHVECIIYTTLPRRYTTGLKVLVTHEHVSIWLYDGLIHRDGDLPAVVISTTEEHKPDIRIWVKHGKIHRATGPALLCGVCDYKWMYNDGPMDYENSAPVLELVYKDLFTH